MSQGKRKIFCIDIKYSYRKFIYYSGDLVRFLFEKKGCQLFNPNAMGMYFIYASLTLQILKTTAACN